MATVAQIRKLMATDEAFRTALIDDLRGVLKKNGIDLPAGKEVVGVPIKNYKRKDPQAQAELAWRVAFGKDYCFTIFTF